MVRVEEHTTIDRPIEEVFAYLSDIERQTEWVSTLQESQKTTTGPTQVGTTYRQVNKILGRTIEMQNEVTTYEPPTVFAFRARGGPTHMEMRLALTSTGPETTEVTQVAEGESGGLFKLADSIVARTLKKQLAADLEGLKAILESGGASEAGRS